MRVGGASLNEIARVLNTSADQVLQLLKTRFDYDAHITDAERRADLQLEVARLDALQNAIWPEAMLGDPKCVQLATTIVVARAKLKGLETVDPVVNKNLVLVMGEKEDDYIAQLRAISDDSTPAG